MLAVRIILCPVLAALVHADRRAHVVQRRGLEELVHPLIALDVGQVLKLDAPPPSSPHF